MATPIKDSNGATISVNDAVKLVGIVQSINTLDDRYNEVVVKLLHPVTGAPLQTFTAPANSLIVGS
jgi:hypothetical protein